MLKKYLKALGKRVKETRSYHYKNQVAVDANIEPKQLTRIERGEVDIRLSTLLKLAKALKISPRDLLPPDEPEKPTSKESMH